MVMTPKSLAGRCLLLGIAGGLRSLTPLAALALTHDAGPAREGWRRWPVLRSPWGRALLIGMAAAELVGDKLPATPSRLAPPALLGRVAAAAIAGAALGTEAPRRSAAARGAALAAVGALLGATGGYAGRRALVETAGVPDATVALLEDGAAIALSRAATTS